jgi:hypothetical protein
VEDKVVVVNGKPQVTKDLTANNGAIFGYDIFGKFKVILQGAQVEFAFPNKPPVEQQLVGPKTIDTLDARKQAQPGKSNYKKWVMRSLHVARHSLIPAKSTKLIDCVYGSRNHVINDDFVLVVITCGTCPQKERHLPFLRQLPTVEFGYGL